jgi:hypothetical protein
MTITTEAPALTIDAIFDTVRDLLAESPDFTYQAPTEDGSCVYIADGKGSCVVGQALVKLGVPVAELSYFDQEIGGMSAGPVLRRVLDADGDLFVNPKAVAIEAVQTWQDGARPWGGAIPVMDAALTPGATTRNVWDTYYDAEENA